MRIRNVLQLIHGFIEGGSERQMIQVTRLLHESGQYKVHVASLSTGGVLREEIERLRIPITDYPLTSFYDRNMVVQLRRFAAFLKEHEIEIVHSHDFYSNIFGMAGSSIDRIKGRVASRRETTGTRTEAQKMVERGTFRLAHAIVANSNAVRNQLITEGVGSGKIVTIYNGIDVNRFKSPVGSEEMLASLKLPVDSHRRLITIVANFEHDVKDYPTFLQAAQHVAAMIPEAAFIIAGDGDLKNSMYNLAQQMGLAESAFFIGRCDKVPELLAVSEICVLSSKAEGFSNSILEYMAAGRPVVATDVGGASEAVVEGHTGYLVPAGDHQGMAERIISLLREPEKSKAMGQNGRRLVEQKFSCEARLMNTQVLYKKLLTGKQPEPRF